MSEQALQRISNGQIDSPMTVSDLLAQVNLIQEVMGKVMKDKEHYGVIPGCGDKPALLQPGAQKLMVTFRLAPQYDIDERQLDKGHREYRVTCTLKTIASGMFVGQGAGSACTMEGKWRFRVAPKKLTDKPVPKAYWDLRQTDPAAAQTIIGGKGFSVKKDENGSWMIAEGSSDKVEHDNPADYYNTVLKMACKRALVAAVLTATAASDIFTQDVEEIAENMRVAAAEPPSESTPAIKTPPAKPQTQEKAIPTPHDTTIKLGDVTICETKFTAYREASSKPDALKAWHAWFCDFEDASGQKFEAGTFDKKIGEKLDVLQGGLVALTYKPGKKPGTFEICSIEPVDNLNF
jgi:hypothetical protein